MRGAVKTRGAMKTLSAGTPRGQLIDGQYVTVALFALQTTAAGRCVVSDWECAEVGAAYAGESNR